MTSAVRAGAGESTARLAILGSGDLWAGAAVQIYNTIAGLAETGKYELFVVTLNDGELADRVRELGVSVVVVPESRLGAWSISRRVGRLLREYDPDLVHLHEYKLQVLTTLARFTIGFRAPIVRTFHGRPTRSSGWSSLRMKCSQYLDRLCLRWFTSGVISVSDELGDYLRSRIPKLPVWTIQSGIRGNAGSSVDCKEVRRRHGVQPGVAWIGTAIRLEDVKNPLLLVRSASILASRGVPFVFSIFGDGSLREELQEAVAERGLEERVRLHGHHPSVDRVMSCWDLFVLGSKHEGLPMSLLEAMSAGAACVCTAVGGVPEVIRDGETGRLVPPDDPSALADALGELLRDAEERRRLALRAKQEVEARFSTSAMTQRYIRVYEHCLRSGVPGRSPAGAGSRN